MSGAAITVFLDFEGVLNNDGYDGPTLFDPANVAALDFLCNSLPVKDIVISSSFRRGRTVEQLRAMLVAEGFEHGHLVTGMTPLLAFEPNTRANEIRRWCQQNRPAVVLVLDDMDIQTLPVDQFHRIDSSTGLTLKRVEDLISNFA